MPFLSFVKYTRFILKLTSVTMFGFLKWCKGKSDYEELDNDENVERSGKIFGPDGWMPIFNLFRFATSTDLIYSKIAVICTTLVALCQPYYAFLFGKIGGYFITYTREMSNATSHSTIYNRIPGEILQYEILKCVIIIATLGGISLILQTIAGILWSKSTTQQIKALRKQISEKILNQDIGWFDVHVDQNFSTQLSSDLNTIEEALDEKLLSCLYHQVVFLIGIMVCLLIGWKLTLVCIISLPISVIIRLLIVIVRDKCTRHKIEAYAPVADIVEEVFSSIKTVVAFNGQKKEIHRFEMNLETTKNNNFKRIIFDSFKDGILYFFMYSGCGLSTWFGILLLIEGNTSQNFSRAYTVENIITIIYMTWISCWSFFMALPYLQMFRTACKSAIRILKLIDHNPRINISLKYGLRPMKCLGQITFSKIHFNYPSYPSISILNGFSLEVQPGETIGIIGVPGCNSSACFQLLQRFYDPTYGKILIDGSNVKDMNLVWWRKQIGMVEQAPSLLAGTIAENIRYGKPDATKEEIENATKKAGVHAFIKSLPRGYAEEIEENKGLLSKEHKWKIALARAIIRESPILLIDTTAIVEIIGESEVRNILAVVTKNRTSIILADHLSTVKNANNIYIFSEGHIEFEGSYKDMVNNQKVFYSFQGGQYETKNSSSSGGKESSSSTSPKHEHISKRIPKSVHLKDLLRLNKPEWPWIFIGSISSFIFGASIPLSTILMTDIIGTMYVQNSDRLLQLTKPMCWKFLNLAIISGVSHCIQNYAFSVTAEKLNFRLKSKLFTWFMNQEMNWFDEKENSTSNIAMNLSQQVTTASDAIGILMGLAFNTLSTLLVSIILAIYFNFKLAFAVGIFIPIVLFISYFDYRVINQNAKRKQEMLRTCNSIIDEIINKISTISSLGCGRYFTDCINEVIDVQMKFSNDKYYLRHFFTATYRSFIAFAYAVGFLYGVQLMINEDITYSTVIKICELQISGAWAIIQTVSFRTNISNGLKAARKIVKILNQSTVYNIPKTAKIPIRTSNVNFTKINYSSLTKPQDLILEEFDLNIISGQTVAVVGSKESHGKQAVIDLIQKFYHANSGKISLNGVDIDLLDSRYLRSHLAIITKMPHLFDRTIAENIAYGSNRQLISMDEIIKAAKNANIHEFIISLPLGYDTLLGYKGCLLSISQQQRIAIARALIRNPSILLLEDPTAFLNRECLELVKDALDKAKKNRTCIIISDDLMSIQDADLICFFQHGKIIETGDHQTLLKKGGHYSNLYRAQTFF